MCYIGVVGCMNTANIGLDVVLEASERFLGWICVSLLRTAHAYVV